MCARTLNSAFSIPAGEYYAEIVRENGPEEIIDFEYSKEMMDTAVLNALGMSWFILLIITAGFFAGVVALFNSMRIGRTILKYMFTLWGLIMLFEIRYFINRSSSLASDYNGILTMAAVALLTIALAYMMYRSYRDKSIAVMVVFNSIAIVLNIIFIVMYFVSFSGAMTDRHIHYLSLFLIAAIVLQTYEAAKTFLPLVKWNLKDPRAQLPFKL